MEVRKVHYSGHSLVIGLPKSVCEEAEIRAGDHLGVMAKQKGQVLMHKMMVKMDGGWQDVGEPLNFPEGGDDNGEKQPEK